MMPSRTLQVLLAATTALLLAAAAQALDLAPWLEGPARTSDERARDAERHPAETLAFFGIEADMQVVELLPGRGWYTAILAPLLRDAGTLVIATPGADNPSEYLAKGHNDLMARLAALPSVYDRVRVRTLAAPAQLDLGPPASADAVVSFRSLHNWIRSDTDAAVLAAVYAVLKPGGVFGLEQHRAAEGKWTRQDAESGYVPQSVAIALAGQAGFVFEASAEINANPRDTRDHPKGVWTLPPTLRLGDVDRDRYLAIGESDRMTLRFRKPVDAAPATNP